MRNARHVNVMRRKEQKERLLLVLLNPGIRLLHPCIRQILITKTRRLAARVKSNAADPIVNRTIVPVTPVHLERLAMR